METTALAARQLRAQRAFYRVMTISTPGGHLIQRAGAQAAVLASAPDQATPNGVVGERGAVRAALGAVAAAYDAAGVRAWMVWLSPGDDATPAALAAAGLRLAGEPAFMGAALEDLDLEPRGAIELADDSSWGMFGRLVDRANDIPAVAGFESFMREIDGGAPVRRYVALADGEPAACVLAHADAGNVAVYCAATVARARGRGLCSELMRLALRDGRDRGCTTTTLEATPMGEPVYTRLGYRLLGRGALWEYRRAR
jgi:ribosomal protein S18 acetylase RimI-like enzyme